MKVYNMDLLRADLTINCGREYQQCKISLMDTMADPDITFDEEGISNYYYEYKNIEKEFILNEDDRIKKLNNIIDKIKKEGIGKKYDCITGVSGGVDSTYLALKAKQLGLRPLLVHFDNGWNSETAVQNVQNII